MKLHLVLKQARQKLTVLHHFLKIFLSLLWVLQQQFGFYFSIYHQISKRLLRAAPSKGFF